MSTSYDILKDRFFKRLRNDKKFFEYKGLTDIEIGELVDDHFSDLLLQSIEQIYTIGTPQIDLYDVDDIIGQFNKDLTTNEIGLLVSIMYCKYFEEDRNRLHEFMITFKSSELSQLSPANERNSFLAMVNDMSDKVDSNIGKYLSTDRITGKIKTSQSQFELR